METLIVVAIVFGALAFVGRRAWATISGKRSDGPSDGGCSDCH